LRLVLQAEKFDVSLSEDGQKDSPQTSIFSSRFFFFGIKKVIH